MSKSVTHKIDKLKDLHVCVHKYHNKVTKKEM